MKKIIFIVSLLMAFNSCSSNKENKEPSEKKIVASVVDEANKEKKQDAVNGQTDSVAYMNNASFNGILMIPPQKKATVTVLMGGVVKSTSLLPGKYIQKGQIIATLENPEFITLQQTYLESRAQVNFLKQEYERQKVLVEGDAASKKRMEQALAEYLVVKSKCEASAVQLGLYGVNVASLQHGIKPVLTVVSPINGYIANLKINVGKYVSTGEALCDVIDKSTILLKLSVYEKDLGKVHIGSELLFRVNGIPGREFKASIVTVGQQIDENGHMAEVIARVSIHESAFRPGMFVTARLLNEKK